MKSISIAEIKPSTRDVCQFLPQRAGVVGTVMCLVENRLPLLTQSQLTDWEDREISALTIQTEVFAQNLSSASFKNILEVLSCPLIRMEDVSTRQDLIFSRSLGFDAQISGVSHLSGQDIGDLFDVAQSMHFRFIPVVSSIDDWQKISGYQPRVILLTPHFNDDSVIPQNVLIIAEEGDQQRSRVRGVMSLANE